MGGFVLDGWLSFCAGLVWGLGCVSVFGFFFFFFDKLCWGFRSSWW